ncbi:MAG: NADH:flavin oxidoreductase [Clostridiales Family XIII bacterium]|jgi:2,4-dienoyl-CoA reductase (NADPH2)|nr:NADH:flavin oxidoreductase [Clostridiales Family XIII bacterium]
MRFDRLFQPIHVNGMLLKNRVVMTAIHLQYTEGGHVNERLKQFYWRRAEGGAALCVVGGCAFENHMGYPDMLRIDSDGFIPGFRELTEGMHRRDCKVALQLMQTGRYGKSAFISGDDAVIAPSAVYSAYSKETPRAMTLAEIKTVVSQYAEAAERARRAGFDAVEVTGASGYLISQFLSPVTNLRQDEYGGSWENRCRFPMEVVTAVRAAVGKDYPVFVRIAGNEFVEGGNTG